MGKGKHEEAEEKPRKRKRYNAPQPDGNGGNKKKKKNLQDGAAAEVSVKPKWLKTVVWSQVPELRLLERRATSGGVDLGEVARKEAEPSLYRMSKPVIIDSGESTLKGMYVHSQGRIASWHKDRHIKLWDLKGTNGAMTNTCMAQLHECPQDMSWHPEGNKLFAAFKSASRAQAGFFDLARGEFQLLRDRPHSTGFLRCIKFLPWQVSGAPCFATGGDDHSVVLWKETQAKWTSQKVYNCHSSSVYGVAGSIHRPFLCSASIDKYFRVVDVVKGKEYFSGKFENSLLGVEFNPVDPNLILLTGCVENKQLMLLDLRYLDPESLIHSFGWEIVDKQPVVTRCFQQCWSLDGLYVSTGSSKGEYRIYDIRYNSPGPSQTVRGTKSPVVKVQWHPVVRNLLVTATKAGRFWLQQHCTV